MRPIDSLIIRLPVGSGWPLYEAAFEAARRFRADHDLTACEVGRHPFRARWTGSGSVVVELGAAGKKRRHFMRGDVLDLLGKFSDAEIARRVGCSRGLVNGYRNARGIPSVSPNARLHRGADLCPVTVDRCEVIP